MEGQADEVMLGPLPQPGEECGFGHNVRADNLSRTGWGWGCVATVDARGRTIWIADAHRGGGKRFVVCGHEKLTALF